MKAAADARRLSHPGQTRGRAGQLASACASMVVFAILAATLGAWACALEAWDTPTARTLVDDVRYHMAPWSASAEASLWLAAASCDSDAVHRLVANGAPVRHDMGGGRGTPLHAVAAASASARGDCIDAAATLVRAGADPLARDSATGRTAFEMALACDRLESSCPVRCRRNPPLGLFLQSTIDGRRARALAPSR
nr:ankyrin repeat protein [Pandoravirus massiliensis]